MVMKVFLTGISGFLGRHVALQLIELKYDVLGLIRTQNIPECLTGLPIKYCYGDLTNHSTYIKDIGRCDAVIHTAALTSFDLSNKERAFLVNTNATKELLKISVNSGIKRFIYISTRGTLGVNKWPEYSSEKSGYKNFAEMNTYLKTKYLAEKEVIEYGNQGKIFSLVLSPTAMIGEFDDKPTPIGNILLSFLKGEIKVFMDGGINIVDVEEVASVCVKALSQGKSGEVYIIGNQNILLYDLFEKISSKYPIKIPKIKIPLAFAYLAAFLLQIKARLTHKSPMTTVSKVTSLYNNHSYCSSKKASNEFGINKIPLSETLNKTINWFCKNNSINF